jgi:FkbM family methyltransferase
MRQVFKNWINGFLQKIDLEIRNRRFAYVTALEDIARILNGVINPVIFDVGANRGDTVAAYKEVFPGAQIHAFEPTPELIDTLNKRFLNFSDITIVPNALSNADGTITFHLMSTNVFNSILPLQGRDGEYYGATEKQEVQVKAITGTRYCNENKIPKIDLLKLDIQGAEKLALAGMKALFEAAQISMIYLELTFVPAYEEQTSFGEIEKFMNSFGYRLYGFYDFSRESNGCLDYCNALYISPKLYAQINPHYLF